METEGTKGKSELFVIRGKLIVILGLLDQGANAKK